MHAHLVAALSPIHAPRRLLCGLIPMLAALVAVPVLCSLVAVFAIVPVSVSTRAGGGQLRFVRGNVCKAAILLLGLSSFAHGEV